MGHSKTRPAKRQSRVGLSARMFAVGPRTFLRRPTQRDRHELCTLVRASKKLHKQHVQPPGDADSFDAWLRSARQKNQCKMLLCNIEERNIIGYLGLNEIIRGCGHMAFLGYWIGQPFASQGFMTEGVHLALHVAFRQLGLNRIEANIQPKNDRSIALVKRCGFRKEGYSPRYLKISGRWRDHERWAILAHEWKNVLRVRGGTS